MVRALAGTETAGQRNLHRVRAWWRVMHPPPSLIQRLDFLYTVAFTATIVGFLAYGTASAAAAQVVTPHWLATFGPSLAVLALFITAQWGAYHGPVVFSVPDIHHLLGAPLSRHGLAARRLVAATLAGAAVGAAGAGLLIVGLAGEGRGIAVDRGIGLAIGMAELGALAVAASWAVERSARAESLARRATWPTVLAAAALAAAADSGDAGRQLALWSGPWGWAVQPAAGVARAEWIAALCALTAMTAVAAGAGVRGSGDCPTERHLRRAEGRQSAIASVANFDARTARQSLGRVAGRPAGGSPMQLRRLRAAASRHAAPHGLSIVWRDGVAMLGTPGRLAEGTALAAGGTAVSLLNADHPAAVAAAMIVVYVGAARLLSPLRAELDDPDRTRVLLRRRAGRILGAHILLPTAAVTGAAALAAAGCAITGSVPEPEAAAAAAAVAAAPLVTFCAALSARRRGRVPQRLVMTATVVDPAGGGLAILSWLAYWPSAAAVLGGTPFLLVVARGGGAAAVAAAWVTMAAAGLGFLVRRDPVESY
jgi:hypothetical protein